MNIDELMTTSRLTPVGNGDSECPCNDAVATSAHKWWASIMIGILFFLLSNPITIQSVDKLIHMTRGDDYKTAVRITILGTMIRTLLFILIVRIILW